MSQKKKADVSTPSSTYEKMVPRWELIDTLLGGTEAMRAAGERFLPPHPQESKQSYYNRLNRSVLFNATEQTLETLVSRPFAREITLGEDVPEPIVELAEDIDLQGNNLHRFCRNWFRVGLAKGLSHVLVDHPRAEPREDGTPRTLEDDRRDGLRPYWVHVAPENVLAAYAEVRNGREFLTHVRIRECSVEREGFEEVVVERIRVLEPGYYQVWERDRERKQEWVLVEDGPTGLDFVPLVTFYAGEREGLMDVKPPLTDLAHLNVAHWQSASDQQNILTVSRFPILAGSGVGDQQGEVKIGPNNWLTTEDPQGKWYFVETTGAAIEAGRKDLEELEDKMAAYGAELLRKRVGAETATGRALDASEAVSKLGAWVMDFKDAVELALEYTAAWMRLETGGSVVLTLEDPVGEAAQAEIDALLKMRASRDISRQTLLAEVKRRGILAEDFDPEEDASLLETEGALGLGLFGKALAGATGAGGEE